LDGLALGLAVVFSDHVGGVGASGGFIVLDEAAEAK
jgi:hypothetical protein